MTIKALYPTVPPTLNLDFAKTKTLDPRVTFTRASTGTFVAADGLIKTAPSGAARFDHNPTTGESLGLLVEEARTNLTPNSMPTTAGGSGGGLTNTLVTGLPGIFSTGRRLTSSGGNDVRIAIEGTTALPDGVTYAFSFFARLGTQGNGIYVRRGTGSYVAWNLLTGTIVRDDFGTSRIVNCGNGWYKCSSAINGTLGGSFLMGVGDAGLNAANGDNIIIAGVQNEVGTFPTSYIPTSGSTVTRAADVAIIGGSNFSSWYRNSSSTFALKGRFISRPINTNAWGILSVTAGSADSNFRMRIGASAGTQFAANRFDNGANYEFNLPGSITAGSTYNYAVGYDDTGHAASSPLGFSSITYPALPYQGATSLTFVPEFYGASHTVARLTYYPVRLTDAQLQALTR